VPFAFVEVEFPEVKIYKIYIQWGQEIIYEDRMDIIDECEYVC